LITEDDLKKELKSCFDNWKNDSDWQRNKA
jgi:hypothetical protein